MSLTTTVIYLLSPLRKILTELWGRANAPISGWRSRTSH